MPYDSILNFVLSETADLLPWHAERWRNFILRNWNFFYRKHKL